jgi:hypothetical protein
MERQSVLASTTGSNYNSRNSIGALNHLLWGYLRWVLLVQEVIVPPIDG